MFAHEGIAVPGRTCVHFAFHFIGHVVVQGEHAVVAQHDQLGVEKKGQPQKREDQKNCPDWFFHHAVPAISFVILLRRISTKYPPTGPARSRNSLLARSSTCLGNFVGGTDA
jgi:hypothetical protein